MVRTRGKKDRVEAGALLRRLTQAIRGPRLNRQLRFWQGTNKVVNFWISIEEGKDDVSFEPRCYQMKFSWKSPLLSFHRFPSLKLPITNTEVKVGKERAGRSNSDLRFSTCFLFVRWERDDSRWRPTSVPGPEDRQSGDKKGDEVAGRTGCKILWPSRHPSK